MNTAQLTGLLKTRAHLHALLHTGPRDDSERVLGNTNMVTAPWRGSATFNRGGAIQISSDTMLFHTPFQTNVATVSNAFQTLLKRMRLRAFHTLLTVSYPFQTCFKHRFKPCFKPLRQKQNPNKKKQQKTIRGGLDCAWFDMGRTTFQRGLKRSDAPAQS